MTEKSTAVQAVPEPKTLRLVEPQTLLERINRIHEDIARRAFEIFESEGGILGREIDHWFKAEAELLHPTHINITESGDTLNLQAEVPGFSASELEVSVEPRRLTISGKKETTQEEKRKGKTIYREQCSSELLRVVDLPAEVDATKVTATLKNGILDFSMPKGTGAKTTHVAVRAA